MKVLISSRLYLGLSGPWVTAVSALVFLVSLREAFKLKNLNIKLFPNLPRTPSPPPSNVNRIFLERKKLQLNFCILKHFLIFLMQNRLTLKLSKIQGAFYIMIIRSSKSLCAITEAHDVTRIFWIL